MGTFLVTIREARAKREAARQYVRAADRFRWMARVKRASPGDDVILAKATVRRDEIADRLMAEARYEITE